MNEFHKQIKKRRVELGLTMLDVSKFVGVSEATVSRWESGSIENMKMDKVELLAKVLKLSPSELMGWNNGSELYRKRNIKKYTLEVIENDVGLSVHAENYGFTSLEVLGLYTLKINDIVQQMEGKIKPDVITRTVIKDEQEEEI